MTAFRTGLGTLFSDPNMSEAASYVPVSGATVSLRVVRNRAKLPQVMDPFGKSGHYLPAYAADVKAADLAGEPRDGDRLEVGGDVFTVRSAELDEEKLVWKLNLDKVG